jgi:DNA mismatch repair protein MutL
MSLENPVRTLNVEVARKIAAGEVIDRPNAIVRELMDNAIDSGATKIIVEISGGGIEKIRIIDNGCGMTKEDLQNCARPHATSKISTEVDLMNLTTLGFRGEALASIAAVARLSIISGGFKMRASVTEDHIIEEVPQTEGTIVQSEGLFENFPARRQFLKRAGTEALMCKNTFIEKALARPDIAFKFIQDGETKLDLPENQSLKDRFCMACSYKEPSELFYQLENSSIDGDWSFSVVIGEPAVSRTNKKEIFIYTNGRRIQEYALVQAVEYGGQGFFPNGTYPVAAVFINIRPDLIDFNIHPAKREARFYDISSVHHGLSSTLKAFFMQYTRENFESNLQADEINQNFLFELNKNKIENDSQQNQNNDSISDAKTFSNNANYDFNSLSNVSNQTNNQTENQIEENSENYKKHISYKTPVESSHTFSDFRSQYLGIKNTTSGANQSEAKSFEKRFDFNLMENVSKTTNLQTFSQNDFSRTVQVKMESSENQNNQINKNSDSNIKFLGSCLGTFLLAQKDDCLFVIDQHAAHERILFDRIISSQGDAPRQQLLIPYKIKTESKSQDNQLLKLKERLCNIGFEINQVSEGNWEISTTPDRWTGTEYDLKTLLFVKQVEPEQIIRAIAAMTACKAAVKDGYVLDDITAEKLVKQAFTLEDPHCPHGRPIYTVFSREKLFELVKRT